MNHMVNEALETVSGCFGSESAGSLQKNPRFGPGTVNINIPGIMKTKFNMLLYNFN
jgi:hypothetical protein